MTCFFCQNLLSDFLEGILPSNRHQEMSKHIDACKTCSRIKDELEKTLSLIPSLQPNRLDSALTMRLEEASLAAKTTFLSKYKWKHALWGAVPVVLFLFTFLFPSIFPWVSYVRNYEGESNFSRYFPLLQGANEIIDEQANWLHSREPLTGSVWEEGGMSPEEYEKAFQKPSSKEATR